jgi:hypothetical protein
MVDDTLLALESFVEYMKSSLDITMCTHHPIAPYVKWTVDYLIITTLCPTDLIHHPRYQSLCVNYNEYGKILHHFLQTDVTITKYCSLNVSRHELTVLDNINLGWQLLQEWCGFVALI